MGPPPSTPTTLPPVPSKAALRALRRLAWSPLTLAVTAFGSACGVAAVNHDVRRRIHLAEQIIETKNVLRSISHGTADSHLQSLFSAAERGEDCTMKSQRRKSFKLLTFAAAPAEENKEFDGGLDAAEQGEECPIPSLQGKTFKLFTFAVAPPEENKEVKVGFDAAEQGGKRLTPSLQGNTFKLFTLAAAPAEENKEVGGLDAAEQRKDRRVQFQSRERYMLYSFSAARADENKEVDGGHDAAEQGEDWRVQSERRKRYMLYTFSAPPAEDNTEFDGVKSDSGNLPNNHVDHRRVASSVGVDQESLSKIFKSPAPRQGASNTDRSRSLDKEERNSGAFRLDHNNQYTDNRGQWFRPFDFVLQPGRRRFTTNVSIYAPQPWLKPPDDPPREDESKDLRTYLMREDTETTYLDGWDADRPPWWTEPRRVKEAILADQTLSDLSHCTAAPLLKIDAPIDSLPPSYQNASRQLRLLIGDSTHDRILHFIFKGRRNLSLEVPRWQLVLRYFLAQASEDSIPVAAGLVLMYRCAFPLEVCTSPLVLKIVEHLLAEESTFDQAGEIFFPLLSSNLWQNPKKTNNSLLAVAYLKHFFETHQDFDQWDAELRKVLLIAKASGISLSEDFTMPIIEALCHAGNMDRVVITLDELEKQYGISVTQDSLEALSYGYAAAGSWKDVSSVLEVMHSRGYSRNHSARFQSFYARLIELYSVENTAESCFGFTILTVKNSGLIPGIRVSRAITCAAIRDGRHELIHEWGRLVDKVYSRLDPPFSALEGALQFSEACRRVGASCVEIASACEAMAYGARKDPFSKYFRACVSGLVREDLIYRLQAIRHFNQNMPDDLDSASTDSLIALAREIERSKPKFSTMRPSEAKLQWELAQQIDAVEQLKVIFEGGVSMMDLYGREESRKVTPSYQALRRPSTQRSAGFDQAPSSTPENLKQSRMPSYPEMVETVLNDYIWKRKTGGNLDHSLLKYVVGNLARCFRGGDAIRLIRTIYESDNVKGVHGIPFDEEIFTTWIRLAMESGAQDSMRALWAAIDSIRFLNFTNDFQLLTLLAHGTERHRNSGYWPEEWAKKGIRRDEREYIYLKLATTRRSTRDKYHINFPAWNRWEEAMRNKATAEQQDPHASAIWGLD
jgi:hypothetical protein